MSQYTHSYTYISPHKHDSFPWIPEISLFPSEQGSSMRYKGIIYIWLIKRVLVNGESRGSYKKRSPKETAKS